MAPASLSTVESSARGRDANTAYLYERIAEGDHEHAEQPDSPHVMRRGASHDAAQLVRGIIAARDDRARTAHQVAASTDREDPTARRWWWSIWPIPMLFGGRRMGRAILAHQIRGVYAMPVVVAGRYVGALDLFRTHPPVCWVPSSWPVQWWRPSWPRCRCWISSQRIYRPRLLTPTAIPGPS